MATIDDAGGAGKARVSNGLLNTLSIGIDVAEITNSGGGLFVITATETPTNTTDYFFYCQNLSSVDQGINEIIVTTSASAKTHMYWVDGTPTYSAPPGTNAIVTNANSGSATQFGADVRHDPQITTLTDDGYLGALSCTVADEPCMRLIKGAFILAPGRAFALRAGTAAGTVYDVQLNVGASTGAIS